MASLRDNANIGRRLRELRLERGLQQADVARTLGVSAAYLNLIEKGKRTVQLPLLWKALSFFGIEMEAFMASLGERRAPDALAKLLDEPLLRSLGITNEDILDFSGEPKRTAMLVALFNLYKNTRTQLEQVAHALGRGAAGRRRARDAFETGAPRRTRRSTRSPTSCRASATTSPSSRTRRARIRLDHKLGRRILSDELVKILKARMVRVELHCRPARARWCAATIRRSAPRRCRRRSSSSRLKFQLARDHRPARARRVAARRAAGGELRAHARRDAAPHQDPPRQLLRRRAAACPTSDFISEVERTRYDIELLVEPVRDVATRRSRTACATSAIPKRPGIPLHFLRVRRRRQHLQALLGDGPPLPARRRARARSGRCTTRS